MNSRRCYSGVPSAEGTADVLRGRTSFATAPTDQELVVVISLNALDLKCIFLIGTLRRMKRTRGLSVHLGREYAQARALIESRILIGATGSSGTLLLVGGNSVPAVPAFSGESMASPRVRQAL